MACRNGRCRLNVAGLDHVKLRKRRASAAMAITSRCSSASWRSGGGLRVRTATDSLTFSFQFGKGPRQRRNRLRLALQHRQLALQPQPAERGCKRQRGLTRVLSQMGDGCRHRGDCLCLPRQLCQLVFQWRPAEMKQAARRKAFNIAERGSPPARMHECRSCSVLTAEVTAPEFRV